MGATCAAIIENPFKCTQSFIFSSYYVVVVGLRLMCIRYRYTRTYVYIYE